MTSASPWTSSAPCSSRMPSEGAELEICFALGGGGLDVDGRVTGGSSEEASLHPVAAELLALVVDRYEVAVDRSCGRTFRFRKQPGGGQE